MDENTKKTGFKGWQVIIIMIVTAIVASVASTFVYYNYLEKKEVIVNTYDENSTLEKKLNEIRTALDRDYLNNKDIDNDKLLEAALKGYVNGVGDEYTELMTKTEYDSLTEQLSDYVGIGVYVAQTTSGEVVILAPVGKDSPAFAAGVKEGDIIVKVDGEDVAGMALDQVVAKMKGQENTKVKVTVKREDKEHEYEITRKDIKVAEITSKMLDNEIGYIDFDSFTEEAGKEFEDAYNDLKSKGAKKLIIDLRNNTGGYVSTAERIMDLFLDKGEIEYITVDNKGNELTTVSRTGKTINMPVVILINEYSASASEIFTGCMKDHKLATVIGTKSYGKGVIQTIKPILGGDAFLKVTTMKYVTPDKNEINKVGITPDKEIELKESEKNNDEIDNQIEEAMKTLK